MGEITRGFRTTSCVFPLVSFLSQKNEKRERERRESERVEREARTSARRPTLIFHLFFDPATAHVLKSVQKYFVRFFSAGAWAGATC